MAYNKNSYRQVREAFDQKRKDAQRRADLAKIKLYEEHPELRKIDEALSLTAMRIMEEIRKGSDGIDERIKAVQKENEQLQQARAGLLVGFGYTADATEPAYECPLCEDRGFKGTQMCSCFKKALTLAALETSGLGSLLKTQSFESFDLAFYQGEDRKNAEQILSLCRQYAANFTLEKAENLTFIGNTGLGKTHMSTAIAKVVIEKGFDVVYETAQNIVSAFEEEKFSYDKQGAKKTEKYMLCDLLIIDDLGTEAQTQFTVSFIYNMMNTRINNGKKTIISTNLDHDELRKRYGDRIASRLFGEYVPIRFSGKDVRMQKLSR
ncbi:MAG: ATP-binding protein [Clostridiales bacterium]|nr:ATP-binding protein [Clostridiales bacterium]